MTHLESVVKYCLLACMLLVVVFPGSGLCASDEQRSYVGSKACSQCHAEQFERFVKYSKKAHAWNSIAIMKPKLSEDEFRQCFECHTTGYGKKGGFVSEQATPDLAEVGCETCHGPGSAHAASGDTGLISRKPALETCTVCHNSERVKDFSFKPLLSSGAH